MPRRVPRRLLPCIISVRAFAGVPPCYSEVWKPTFPVRVFPRAFWKGERSYLTRMAAHVRLSICHTYPPVMLVSSPLVIVFGLDLKLLHPEAYETGFSTSVAQNLQGDLLLSRHTVTLVSQSHLLSSTTESPLLHKRKFLDNRLCPSSAISLFPRLLARSRSTTTMPLLRRS